MVLDIDVHTKIEVSNCVEDENRELERRVKTLLTF